MNPQRKAFLDAIEADPYDETNRKVFADWLEENDEPEEADFFRSWTLQKHQESEQWLRDFADSSQLSYEEVVDIGRNYRDYGDYHVERGSSWVRDNFCGQEEIFWGHWSIVTGVRIGCEDGLGNPFSCSC